MDVKEFVRCFPKAALSAHYVLTLENAEQPDLIVCLVDDAVFCDSWEAYFDFAERNNVMITESVALGAVQAVGLDPLSASLWVKAAACCVSTEAKKSLYEFGLSVPLYNWQRLYAEYRNFAEQPGVDEEPLSEEECSRVGSVALNERWPNRYLRFDTDAEVLKVRREWLHHIAVMIADLDSTIIARDLQLRRIELAMRQMCTQLPGDDSCWYQYALFQLRMLEEKEAAMRTVVSGMAAAGPSFALENIAAVVETTLENQQGGATAPDTLSATEVLLQQRHAAEQLADRGVSKEGLRSLRVAGKAAAQQGLSDWKIFSQWRSAEDMTAHDSKMAARVLENGMICCSHSPNDALLLGSEAAAYHLLQRHERETLGYAEQQIGQQAGLHHRGKILASWNSLVRIESLLGLSFSKAAERRARIFPQSPIMTFIEHCRVGDYLPCCRKTFEWIQFTEDYNNDKASVEETPFVGIVPPHEKALSAWPVVVAEYELPEDSLWEAFKSPPNSHPPAAEDEPDEVTGARELRGKLAYRVKIDPRTAARCRRDEATRQRTSTAEESSERETALGSLLRRLHALNLTDRHTRKLQSVSPDWLVRILTISELDLDRTLREREERQQNEEETQNDSSL